MHVWHGYIGTSENICIYLYMYIYMWKKCIHVHIQVKIYVYMYTCTYTCEKNVYMCVYMQEKGNICTHVKSMYMHTSYVHVHVDVEYETGA